MERSLASLAAELADRVGELLDVARAPAALAGAHDRDVLAAVTEIERLGRFTDTLRVHAAGEIEHRSRISLGREGLAAKKGCTSAVELLEHLTRVSMQTARTRLKLGAAVRRTSTLLGDSMPPRFERVAEGLRTGELGIDSASVITKALDAVLPRHANGDLDGVRAAEHELVCAAIGVAAAPGAAVTSPATATETRMQAAVWAEVRQPTGFLPIDDQTVTPPAGTGAGAGAEQSGRAEHPAPEASGRRDPRTRAQRQHDAIATVFDIAARADELPTLGGASPTIVVTVLADDLRTGHGVGHVDGIDEPISMRAVEQHASANGIQRVTLAANGRIVGIGTTERCFNRTQRRALAARDGGCIIPGCDTPAWATEVHHVIPWWHGGATHTDNGVLLCWFHHRSIDSSGWRIRMAGGAPEVMPPPGMGPQQWCASTVSPARRAAALARRRAGPTDSASPTDPAGAVAVAVA
ncbi:DUF222 domain-containing protein [Agromyces sp. NPDC056965]|uniref:HNH endonuclease signature motif containing protein n=1 Tax=Agromyces sp. NPDC056965 TaxID=3345983 RepID=UPI0036273E1A